ncbi:MAG: DUF5916 domain-containing protein [Kofleriaceae bacterium]
MIRSLWFVVAVVLGLFGVASGETRARAIRRASTVTIDGVLEEAAWATAPRHTGFTQRFPKDGVKANVETHFAVLYDDNAVYVGVWADDPEPDKIRRLLTRRDVDAPADAITIGIDSYHDQRTAYAFQLNAAGVQRDMLMFDDTETDDTWDAVWTGDVSVNATGWCAEFRIPLSQLRYASDGAHEWGFQVIRIVPRTQEQAAWAPWPRSSEETVSKFGIIEGISGLKPARRLELLPYATAGFESMPVADADPLNDPLSARGNIGLDLKYGLGPAFTLSATINPDFGQVEADPSQVNLSANELFFAEKRPFFLEGVDLFKLSMSPTNNGIEGGFYSRRIGAAPPIQADGEYVRSPPSTTIFGAMKLTGKTRGGWSVGLLDAVTGEEVALVDDGMGGRTEPIVSPLTNYAIARVKRDFRSGKTSVGGSLTAVNRALSGTGLEAILHDQAYTGGTQLSHRWDKNAWQFDFNLYGSLVHGSEMAIARTQQSQRHLFQRSDNDHFDPTRTSLTGLGFGGIIGRMGDTKHWRYGVGYDVRTSGYELNDAGFMNGADRSIVFLYGEYHEEKPSDEVLNWHFNADIFTVHILSDTLDSSLNAFESHLSDIGFECNGHVQLVNYWKISQGCNLGNARWATNDMRGGPALRVNNFYNGWIQVDTDSRKSIQAYVFANGGQQPATDTIDGGIEAGLKIQAASNIDIDIGPRYSYRNDALQYVDTAIDDNGLPHYVYARINQATLAMTTRVNWTFSPKLSLQAYAQPFIATGRYRDYKDIDNPAAKQYEDRFTPIDGTDYALVDGTYRVNQNGRYEFARPDFSFGQLRSTVVLRWEYRPGSSVFAIWSHGQTATDDDGRFDFNRNSDNLFSADSEDVVMVKANYWIGF